jgi:hypothetical protein
MPRSSCGQRGPDHHQVGVALVVGKVDALLGLGRAAVPAGLRAGQQADQAQQEQAHGLGGERREFGFHAVASGSGRFSSSFMR